MCTRHRAYVPRPAPTMVYTSRVVLPADTGRRRRMIRRRHI